MAQPPGRFLDALCQAFRTRGKPISEHERSLARRLSPVLWSAVKEYRQSDDSDLQTEILRESAAELAEADRAQAIAQRADRLLQLLNSVPRVKTLGDVYSNPWAPFLGIVDAARIALAKLIGSARHLTSSLQRARRPPGRRVNRNRIFLSEWIAIQLAKAGVRPTKSKAGPYARILALVRECAGLPNCAPANVERDIRRALNNPHIASCVARLLKAQSPVVATSRRTTHSRSRKIAIA